ncbi:Membrane fusion protein of RND family multidrug efflux pump [Rhodovulum sp. P5]|uniref:efflux RND transporter periplasmic adaptor subunit n=1 Tax=Rhodovulum sp. P5 TaxID=1564506 RepID=UPI0009C3B2DA|nr:HlyD family efflux transporter periplasmic adaptor subunit [Rhodovulum sp. P5]ARE41972.1 Membrane fusion protein of RND family multidrug efflux pump [Rhodovulum sp. P5]
MSRLFRSLSRIAALSVPLGLGVLAISFAGALKDPPSAQQRSPKPTPVRVITLAPMTVTPRITGYGVVAPAREWRAVARIEAEVAATDDRLAPGEIVAAGTELLRLDDTDLRLSLAQIDAQLAALDVKDETLTASLEISRADLTLSRAELRRQEDLAAQGVATRAALDQSRRQELSARARLTEIENQLALNRAEREVLQTQRKLAERNLDFTSIRAPYDMRLTDVSAELGQVVSRGQVLMSAEGTEAVEIAAQFALGKIGPLVRMLPDGGTVTDLKARVRLPVEGHDVIWKAELVRVGEAIDPTTQSTALIVRVDDPLGQAQAGARPPLRRNTYVEVILSAPTREALVAPAEAVRGGTALVATSQNTLERRAVAIRYTMDGIALLAEGLAPGDKLVVTDPAIAVPGMTVKPVEDKATLARLTALATGKPSAGSGQGTGQGGGQGKGQRP